MNSPEYFAESQYGFDWGALQVTRVLSHKGSVLLSLIGKRGSVDVWVTPTGMIKLNRLQGCVEYRGESRPKKRKSRR